MSRCLSDHHGEKMVFVASFVNFLFAKLTFSTATMFPDRSEAKENTEAQGEQNSLFPEGSFIKYFVVPRN